MIENIILCGRNSYVTYVCQCHGSEWLSWVCIVIASSCFLGVVYFAYKITKEIVEYKKEMKKRELDYLEKIHK